jgi:Ion channel
MTPGVLGPARSRYLYLLVALVVMLVAYPYARSGGILGTAAVLVPIASVVALATHRRHLAVPVALGIVTLAGIVQEAAGVAVLPLLAVEVGGLLLFAYTTIFVLWRVLRSDRVTGDILCGAIAVYLMIGLTWALGFGLVEYLQPGSYRVATAGGRPASSNELLYFSYVTLVTLGYGDIVPVTDGARSLSVLEGLCGTIYLTILVARLIGLHLAQVLSPR